MNAPALKSSLLQTLSDKWAALNTRERWMVLFAGLALVYAVLNSVLLSPLQRQQQHIQNEMAQSKAQFVDVTQQIATLSQQTVVSVDADNTQKIAQMNAKIQAQQTEMTALQDTLVIPAQMPGLLKELIEHHASLRLVDMKTVPPEHFLTDKPATEAPAAHTDQALIYRHAITMTLAGNYMELMRYAQALQAKSSQVLWEKAVLATKTYPENELTITVYTLSLDATWLSI